MNVAAPSRVAAVLIALALAACSGGGSSGPVHVQGRATPGQASPNVSPLAGSPGEVVVPTPGSGATPGAAAGTPGAPATGKTRGVGTTAGPCNVALRATDQGVSRTEIFLAVPIVSFAGEAGNSTFGIRSPENFRRMVEALVAGINAEGPTACRKLVIRTWEVNPLDPVDQQRKCRQILDAKPFGIVDAGGYLTPASQECFLREKLPYQPVPSISLENAARAYPYLYAVKASVDRGARNWVFEAPSRGWFDRQRGFRKLGVFFDSCFPRINEQLLRNLNRVGVQNSQMSVFTLSGCSVINPPSETTAAVAQHRRDDVSHVFLAGNGANGQQYVRQADGIGWKPVYLTSDFREETHATLAPDWPAGFDGAIAITSLRIGERNSGIVHPVVNRCNGWLRKAGVNPSAREEDSAPVSICDQFRLFAAAANAAGPNLTRPTLVGEGLAKLERFEGGMLTSVNVYRSREVSGGQFFRAVRWHVSCRCWKIVDRNLKPAH